MKSDRSMDHRNDFKSDQHPSFKRVDQQSSEVPSGQSAQQHRTQLDSIFMLLEDNMVTFVKEELKKMQKVLSPDYPEYLESQKGDEDEEQRSSREALVKITVHFLRRMKQEELADRLQSKLFDPVFQHKSALKKKFQCVFEGIPKAGNPTLLNQIYTELYITEGGTGEVNDEHEIRHIETASRKAGRAETTIRQEDIFKLPPGRDEPIRTVMTKGVAGIGKTVLTQKFTLDWAEGKANQDIQFMFPFTFRELNVLKEKKFSLVELVHHFFTETKEAGICSFEVFQVVFIFDGLDECRLPLDFHNKEPLTDVTESTSVDVLLTNLIRGKLLPSARLWITTRPAAANQIPPDCVGMVTEVRGFTDPQKEEYFRKRFRDKKQASSIISHIQTSRSLHIMCHIPVFCWITATVLEDVLKTREGGELPKSLTEMYIHFLVVQAKVKKVKYDGGAETDPHWSPESRKMIESLGKLAFEQLQKGNLIFYESDLTECGIDISAASVCSGVFTQIFIEERGLYQEKVFCFIHLSVQEFLAALHVHLTFINSGVNLMEEQSKSQESETLKETLFFQSAVNKALQSPNGHLDLFLRFLLGLSLQTNQSLLRGLLTQTGSSSQTNQETVDYIKKKFSENLSPERSINLFHCLNELNYRSLVEQIQQSLSSGSLSTDKLSPAQWSALVFILLSSGKDLDVFDLKKYSASEEALLRLLPVVKASSKALCQFSTFDCDQEWSGTQKSTRTILTALAHNWPNPSPPRPIYQLRKQNKLIAKEGSRWHCCKHCGKVFKRSSQLRYHHRLHTGEKPYSCGQCGAAFATSSHLKTHQRIHTGEKPYSCGQCGAALATSSHLKTHQHIHTGEKPYSCGQCGTAFTQLSNLKTHQRIHTGEKPYSCGQCGATFTTFSRLKTHQHIHTGEKPYSCGQCGAAFTELSSLKRHQRIHTGEKPYSCGQCGAAFTELSSLKRHQRIHTGEKPYSCGQCGAAFTQLSNLKRHQSSHLRYHQKLHKGEKPYSCCQCGAAFTKTSHLTTHQRIHTGEKPYSCGQCGAAFTTSSNLKTHKRIHTGEKPYSCGQCGAGFTQLANLQRHQRIHTGEKPYSCGQCGAAFTALSGLKKHQRIHTGEKPYSCGQCGTAFTQLSSLKTHQRIHTGEKPYSCGQCGAAFTTSSKLKTHKRIHTGEKPYSCGQCGTAFTHLSSLKTHRRIHTGEKPYSCGQCGAAFTQLSHLKKHQRIHTGEKPYSCSQCGAAFTQSSSLKTHQRIHTGEKPYSCGQCGTAFTQSSSLKTHQRIHTGEKPYSCGQCGAGFTALSGVEKHQHIHTGEKPYSCGHCEAAFTQLSSLKRHEHTHTADK
ncbi:uncharacterized protein [Leuresthes tenuis]|uniref:uncharacterized protein n=1 Tax=Leuresthes tenuis TaxID=355514 RepID=UPI003B5101A2